MIEVLCIGGSKDGERLSFAEPLSLLVYFPRMLRAMPSFASEAENIPQMCRFANDVYRLMKFRIDGREVSCYVLDGMDQNAARVAFKDDLRKRVLA